MTGSTRLTKPCKAPACTSCDRCHQRSLSKLLAAVIPAAPSSEPVPATAAKNAAFANPGVPAIENAAPSSPAVSLPVLDAHHEAGVAEAVPSGQPTPETVSIRGSQPSRFFRPFFDWVSGVPLNDAKPKFYRPPVVHVIDSIGGFVIALGTAYAAYQYGHPLLAAGGVVVAAGRARKAYITVEHQVIHNELFRIPNRKLRRCLNKLVGETIGVLLWVPDPETYHRTHFGSHHSIRDVATPRDKDGIWVFRLGFVPGKSVREYWSLLIRTLSDPFFYAGNAFTRIRMSLVSATRRRRIQSWLFLAAIATGTFATGAYGLLAMYVAAVYVLFPFAGVLQTLGKHFWGCHMEQVGTKARTALVCQGRFLFDRYPTLPLERVWWLVRLLGYHVPAKLLVLSGDVQFHDHHHRHGNTKDWVVGGWARAADIKAGCPGWEDTAPYQQSWSLFGSIQQTFEEMAAAPKLTDEWMEIVNRKDGQAGES